MIMTLWNETQVPYSKFFITCLVLFSLSLPLSKSASNVSIAVLFLSAIFLVAGNTRFGSAVVRNIRQPLSLPLALYLSVALIGLIFTDFLQDGIGIINKIGSILLIYLTISVLLDCINEGEDHQLSERLLLVFLGAISILNGVALLTYLGIVGQKQFILPLAPFRMHHIWFSNLNVIGIYGAASFLIASKQGEKTQGKLFFWAFIAVALLCVLLSLSRTAWFSMLSTSIIMTLIVLKEGRKRYACIVLGAGAALCILLYAFSPIVSSRINQILSETTAFFSGQKYSSLGNRFLMWIAAFKMFLADPMTGVGTGDYVLTMKKLMASGELPMYLSEYNQPHNMYLFALATNGLPGFAVLLYVLYRSLRCSLSAEKKATGERRVFALLGIATVVHYAIAGMTDSLFNIQVLRYTFAFVMAVTVRYSFCRS